MTQDPNPKYDRDEYGRRRTDSPSSLGWGVGIAAAVVILLIALVIGNAWRNNDRNLTSNDTPPRLSDGPAVYDTNNITRDRNSTVAGRDNALDSATPAAGTQQPSLTLQTLSQDPARHYGQSVNINGVVRNVINASAFTIAADQNAQEYLVVGTMAFAPAPTQGQQVRVNGTFNQFDQDRVKTTLGGNFNEGQFSTYSGKPMIFATSVQPAGQMAQ